MQLAVECCKQVGLISISGFIIVLACIKHFVIGFRGSGKRYEAYQSCKASLTCFKKEQLAETANADNNEDEVKSSTATSWFKNSAEPAGTALELKDQQVPTETSDADVGARHRLTRMNCPVG